LSDKFSAVDVKPYDFTSVQSDFNITNTAISTK